MSNSTDNTTANIGDNNAVNFIADSNSNTSNSIFNYTMFNSTPTTLNHFLDIGGGVAPDSTAAYWGYSFRAFGIVGWSNYDWSITASGPGVVVTDTTCSGATVQAPCPPSVGS